MVADIMDKSSRTSAGRLIKHSIYRLVYSLRPRSVCGFSGIWWALIVGAVVVFAMRAYAADDTVNALRREVNALKLTVQQLEKRVSKLEKQASAPIDAGTDGAASPAGGAAPKTRPAAPVVTAPLAPTPARPALSVRDRWRRVRRGMRSRQIEALLGAPQQKLKIGGKTVWYYHYPDNRRGSVAFFEDMRVSGWQAPPAGHF
jgi:hypothetical protein